VFIHTQKKIKGFDYHLSSRISSLKLNNANLNVSAGPLYHASVGPTYFSLTRKTKSQVPGEFALRDKLPSSLKT
jgi:hypothetical protein